MTDAISLWLHLLAVTLWIGPQVFLFAAAIPALRTVEDIETRVRLTRIIVERFSAITGLALVVIVVTGIINIYQIDGFSAPDLVFGDADRKFTRIFWEKMFLVGVAVALVGFHALVIGPRQIRLAEQARADPAEARNVRRLSIMLSTVGLLASIGALYLGALLARHEYSFQAE
jgi:copper resistance protein D